MGWSAWALSALEREFPFPIFGVILPGARAALAATRTKRIGVIATNATVRSHAYNTAILARDDKASIFARACPLLVPLGFWGGFESDAKHEGAGP